MSSIKDVARLAGVSIATVSRYVNTPEQVRAPTAKRVEAAIRKTGYETNWLARNIRTGKTRQIIVVLPSIGIPFYGPILKGVRKVADAAKYHIQIMETAYNSVVFDDFTRLILSKQADGIVLLSSLSPFEDKDPDLNVALPPIVLGLEDISAKMSHLPSVCIDNEAAARSATEYLIGLGHRDIGFLNGVYTKIIATGSNSSLRKHVTDERAAGFRSAMKKKKVPVREDWVIETRLSIDGGRQAAKQLLAMDSIPTALFCANDEMALGAMFEIKKAGLKIPDDISIVGFDNMCYGEISDPPLTTVEQPAERIGERSMERLLSIIEGHDQQQNNEFLPHSLIKRDSCAAPKKQSK